MLLAWAIVAGCNGERPGVPLHPASGKVLVDGQPAGGVEVRLHPAGAIGSIDAMKPFAITGEDGGFTLGTYRKGGRGPRRAVIGVTLFWPDRPPGPQRTRRPAGGAYTQAETSGLEVDDLRGQNELTDLRGQEGRRPSTSSRRPRRQGPSKDRDGVG